jgi:hypothetical protein
MRFYAKVIILRKLTPDDCKCQLALPKPDAH